MADPSVRRHTPALFGDFDAREFAGVELFQFAGQPIMGRSDFGVFSDLLAFLHGYGSSSGQDLAGLMQSAVRLELPAPGATVSVTINAADRVTIQTQGTPAFTLEPSPLNEVLGFPASGTATAETSHTAPNPFRRGVVDVVSGLVLNFDGVGEITLPADGTLTPSQSVPVLLKARGAYSSDPEIDLSGKTLGDAFGTFAPAGFVRFRVNPDGRVSVSWQGLISDLVITNASFWQRLGGTGQEAPVSLGGEAYQLTTDNPAPCVLPLSRGYVQLRRRTAIRDRSSMMADGSIVSSGLSPVRGWNLTARVIGPAFGYDVDQERHLRAWWSHCRRSLTLFPQWGDHDAPARGSIETRRHLDLTGAGTTPNSLFHTTEADESGSHYAKRKGGRLLLRRDPKDASDRVEAYEGEQLDLVQDIEFRLVDDPSR